MAAQLVFPALAALSGVLGGYQFPIAAEIYLHGSRSKARLSLCHRSAGRLRGCALAEHLPDSGLRLLAGTAWLVAAVNLAPALLAARVSIESCSFRKEREKDAAHRFE
jgi:hypothetical protein